MITATPPNLSNQTIVPSACNRGSEKDGLSGSAAHSELSWCERGCGAMDNASDYGSEDSRFDSWQPRGFTRLTVDPAVQTPMHLNPFSLTAHCPRFSHGSIVVSIPRCGRGDPGSNPGRGRVTSSSLWHAVYVLPTDR